MKSLEKSQVKVKDQNVIRLGLLGFGTVGQAVAEIIAQNQRLLCLKTGYAQVAIHKIGVRDLQKKRSLPAAFFSDDCKTVVADPAVDVVVEVLGDCDAAYEAMKLALSLGKPVVTANKAILARHGFELFQIAEANHTEILFEASVAGGIPILRTLREGITCNRILSLKGIINGTSNFILSEMTQKGLSFEAALQLAQQQGYAEADPAFDIQGTDAAYKLAILVMLCHGRVITVDQIFTRGIAYLKPIDIEMAGKFGYVIKLLGITKEDENGFEARVHPTMIPKNHPLAHVDGAFNAISYVGDFVGEGMQYGLGAGGPRLRRWCRTSSRWRAASASATNRFCRPPVLARAICAATRRATFWIWRCAITSASPCLTDLTCWPRSPKFWASIRSACNTFTSTAWPTPPKSR